MMTQPLGPVLAVHGDMLSVWSDKPGPKNMQRSGCIVDVMQA